MTVSSDRNLAADIEAVVRSVAGVTVLFHTGGVMSKIVAAGAELFGASSGDAHMVKVEQSDNGTRVQLALGVRAGAGAAETSRRVYAAVDELCAQRGVRVAEIHITVVHIEEDAAA